ncbi:transglutaminase domain-containing protein [Streptomyces sp. NPDC090077]|uniref:transglutaminase domain-containing protein n=1 Tax=Streptomyces sp. NPDC090077 TaxID=3365938 RepID=UPI00382CE618
MTSSLLRPRRRIRTGGEAAGSPAGSASPTRILDWRDPRVGALVRSLELPAGPADVETLRRVHAWIAATVRPVYSVQDERPVSEVLRRGRGSCSQRMALLEAVARATGTATRVRGLVVDGRFWYPRFPRLRPLVPDQVLLAWPEFHASTGTGSPAWLTVSELFDPVGGGGFTNAGSETLFEALSRTAIDWDGDTAAPVCPAGAGACDLSAYVLTDLGRFASRDDLFARHGQTLCPLARTLAEPVLGRRSAGARTVAA